MCHEPEAFLGRRERSFLRCRASRAKNEETRPVGIPASRSDSRFLELILELNFPYRFPRLRGCANLRNIKTIKISSLGCQFKISPSVREAFSGRRRERRSATQEFETKKRDCWHTPQNSFPSFFQASSSSFEPPHFFARTARLPSRGRLGKGRASTGRSDRSDPESPFGEILGVERVTRGSLGAFASRSRFF